MDVVAKVIVKNAPDYVAEKDKYIVARLAYGEFWFYGAWEYEEDAERVAREFDNACVLKYEA